ncbi:hypothetical protein QYF61_027241 [Mycteria americana]|uniref:Uncharacterized protein n=1 Tax=Mycteria americana TaxID=33587 RepID=A0AAN7MZE7_MYCAM|nr:hypothetical protein QYF61_027241 [Mycteria americana]
MGLPWERLLCCPASSIKAENLCGVKATHLSLRKALVVHLRSKPCISYSLDCRLYVTLWTRVRGEQQHCLNPKRQNTVRLLKWYRVWKEKGSHGQERASTRSTVPPNPDAPQLMGKLFPKIELKRGQRAASSISQHVEGCQHSHAVPGGTGNATAL